MLVALRAVLTALVLCAAVPIPADAAGAAAPSSVTAVRPLAAATPTDSATPPGPKDPGTGESPEAKDTRVDYAPYVIGAALIIAVGAAIVVWRRGGGGPSSKSARGSANDTGHRR